MMSYTITPCENGYIVTEEPVLFSQKQHAKRFIAATLPEAYAVISKQVAEESQS